MSLGQREEIDAEHRKILSEVMSERHNVPSPKRAIVPLILLSIIIMVSLTLWAIPYYNVHPSAKARNVPSIDDLAFNFSFGERPNSSQMTSFVQVSPEIKASAAFIASSTCKNVDKRCYAQALFYFVRDNIKYVNDPLNEYYELPSETLLARSADCDGQAILLASLLTSVGIEYRFAYKPNHVWVQANVPKNTLLSKEYSYEWIDLDTTCKKCRPGFLQADT